MCELDLMQAMIKIIRWVYNMLFFHSRVSDVLISGPLNITKHALSNGEYAIRWTPTRSDLGDHFPVCFIAESTSGWANYSFYSKSSSLQPFT